MITREATILAADSHAAKGTKIVPINLVDPVTCILIPYSVTKGAGTTLAHVSTVFSKIEIVDGSDVLMSLSGNQLAGLPLLDGFKPPIQLTNNIASAIDYGNIMINFGRHKYDERLAFDPTRYKNPQIRLTHDLDLVEADATDVTFALHALIMENMAAKPIGFLMKKEIKSWTAADNTWEYTNMPLDYPYRKIFLQGLTYGSSVGGHFDRIRLSEDNDKRIPFDTTPGEQIARNAMDYGQVMESVHGIGYTAVKPAFGSPAWLPQMAVMHAIRNSETFRLDVRDGGYFHVEGDNTELYRGVVTGYAPQGLVGFDMGTPDVIENWYDVSKLRSLRLEVYGAGALTVRLVTEQLRKYA